MLFTYLTNVLSLKKMMPKLKFRKERLKRYITQLYDTSGVKCLSIKIALKKGVVKATS